MNTGFHPAGRTRPRTCLRTWRAARGNEGGGYVEAQHIELVSDLYERAAAGFRTCASGRRTSNYFLGRAVARKVARESTVNSLLWCAGRLDALCKIPGVTVGGIPGGMPSHSSAWPALSSKQFETGPQEPKSCRGVSSLTLSAGSARLFRNSHCAPGHPFQGSAAPEHRQLRGTP